MTVNFMGMEVNETTPTIQEWVTSDGQFYTTEKVFQDLDTDFFAHDYKYVIHVDGADSQDTGFVVSLRYMVMPNSLNFTEQTRLLIAIDESHDLSVATAEDLVENDFTVLLHAKAGIPKEKLAETIQSAKDAVSFVDKNRDFYLSKDANFTTKTGWDFIEDLVSE